MLSSSFTVRVEVAAFIVFCTRFRRNLRLQKRENPPKSIVYLCTHGLGLFSKGTELSRLLAEQTWCAIFSEGLVGIG